MLVASGSRTGITLSAGIETDLLDGGSTGFDPQNADVIDVTIQETGASNAITTVKAYESSGPGGILAPLSATTSVSASGKRIITIKGYTGGKVRVTGTSTSGSTASCDVGCYSSGNPLPSLQIAFDGVVQGQALGGTVSGNLSQSGGTATIQATGAVVIDGTTSITIGGTNATSVAIGSASVPDSHPGGMTVGNAKSIVGGSTMAVDAASGSKLSVGTNSNAVDLGKAAKVTTVLGSLVLAQQLALPVTTPPAGAYAALVTDVLIKLPTQSAGITVTLPASQAGQVYIIEANSDGAAHNITIAITGGTVNGTATITANYGRRIVTCDGTNAISL